MFVAPEPLLDKPLALCSTGLNYIRKLIQDTYVNHVCSIHPEGISPCECGEPLNQTARSIFPLNSFDPDQKGKRKKMFLMVGTIILSLALAESVSQYGVYIEL